MGKVSEVAMKAANGFVCAEGFVLTVLIGNLYTRQIINKLFRDGDNGVTWTAAAVGNCPSLVKIVVNSVHSQFIQINHSGNCVHVGAIHVDQTSSLVNQIGHFLKG